MLEPCFCQRGHMRRRTTSSSPRLRSFARAAALLVLSISCGGGDGTAPAPAPVATVAVAPLTSPLPIGTTKQLSAATLDANGAPLSGRAVAWTTSDAGIATVTQSGIVTGVALGSATITATSEGKPGSATVAVIPASCASVIQLSVGESRFLSAAQAAEVCVTGGAATSEYLLVPFSTSAVPSSLVAFDVSATNTVAVATPPAPSVLANPFASTVARSSRYDGETAVMERTLAELRALGPRERAPLRLAPASSAATAAAAVPTVGSIIT